MRESRRFGLINYCSARRSSLASGMSEEEDVAVSAYKSNEKNFYAKPFYSAERVETPTSGDPVRSSTKDKAENVFNQIIQIAPTRTTSDMFTRAPTTCSPRVSHKQSHSGHTQQTHTVCRLPHVARSQIFDFEKEKNRNYNYVAMLGTVSHEWRRKTD